MKAIYLQSIHDTLNDFLYTKCVCLSCNTVPFHPDADIVAEIMPNGTLTMYAQCSCGSDIIAYTLHDKNLERISDTHLIQKGKKTFKKIKVIDT